MRYIHLTINNNIEGTFSPYVEYVLNMKELYINSSSILCSQNYTDFKSKDVLLPQCDIISYMCVKILDNLNLHPMKSCNGCSIVCEQLMGNNIMLNILRPAVLRQYYGVTKCFLRSDIVSRCTYILGSKRNNICADPNKFITKPFDMNMQNVALNLKMPL